MLPALAALAEWRVLAGTALFSPPGWKILVGVLASDGYGYRDLRWQLFLLRWVNVFPSKLKIFLTALAVIDDLGAILVIAVFIPAPYIGSTWQLQAEFLGLLFIFNRLKFITHGLISWEEQSWVFYDGIGCSRNDHGRAGCICDSFDRATRIRCRIDLNTGAKPVAFIILPILHSPIPAS